MDRVYGWWCSGCQVWLTRTEVRQTEQDEVCLEVCAQCGGVVEDRRFTDTDRSSP
jgi:hypothetical protein